MPSIGENTHVWYNCKANNQTWSYWLIPVQTWKSIYLTDLWRVQLKYIVSKRASCEGPQPK